VLEMNPEEGKQRTESGCCDEWMRSKADEAVVSTVTSNVVAIDGSESVGVTGGLSGAGYVILHDCCDGCGDGSRKGGATVVCLGEGALMLSSGEELDSKSDS